MNRSAQSHVVARVVALVVSIALASCAASMPVAGQMQRGDETFSGTVTGNGYRSGTGVLTLVSSRKSTCAGNFVYTSRRRGEGVLNCDDGRTGPFHVAAVGATGTGAGELSGQRFTFTFGAQE